MNSISKLLLELEKQGEANDASASSRSEKMLNITPDTGEYLALLLAAVKASDVLEVGTSNGYSTIWIASSMPAYGTVTTLEIQDHKIEMAQDNFKKAGLENRIKLVKMHAGDFFRANTKEYDLVFLDAERVEYMSFADDVISSVRKGGILICDNAISHEHEMREFMNYISESGEFVCCTVPVGKGEFTACRK